MFNHIYLRDVVTSDLVVFFEQQIDPEANFMAAFTAKDPSNREAFTSHWKRIMADDHVLIKTILVDEQIAGSILSYAEDGKPEVSYWLGKDYWGMGICTAALQTFLETHNKTRPIYARVAKDHQRSMHILEKCGFKVISQMAGYANARGAEIEELLLQLN